MTMFVEVIQKERQEKEKKVENMLDHLPGRWYYISCRLTRGATQIQLMKKKILLDIVSRIIYTCKAQVANVNFT